MNTIAIAIGAVETVENPPTREEADRLIDSVSDLIDDPKYRPFYFNKLYTLGVDKFLELAGIARNSTFPARRFATLLKRTRR